MNKKAMTDRPKRCPFCRCRVKPEGYYVYHEYSNNLSCPLEGESFVLEKWNRRVLPGRKALIAILELTGQCWCSEEATDRILALLEGDDG